MKDECIKRQSACTIFNSIISTEQNRCMDIFSQSHSRSVGVHTKQAGVVSAVDWIKWRERAVLSAWVAQEPRFSLLCAVHLADILCLVARRGSTGKRWVGVKPAFLATALAHRETDPFRTDRGTDTVYRAAYRMFTHTHTLRCQHECTHNTHIYTPRSQGLGACWIITSLLHSIHSFSSLDSSFPTRVTPREGSSLLQAHS